MTIEHREKDGWHIFTSPQLPGLFVAHPDFQTALNDVPRSIELLKELEA